jgi:hypothetical protein
MSKKNRHRASDRDEPNVEPRLLERCRLTGDCLDGVERKSLCNGGQSRSSANCLEEAATKHRVRHNRMQNRGLDDPIDMELCRCIGIRWHRGAELATMIRNR